MPIILLDSLWNPSALTIDVVGNFKFFWQWYQIVVGVSAKDIINHLCERKNGSPNNKICRVACHIDWLVEDLANNAGYCRVLKVIIIIGTLIIMPSL